MELLRNKQYLRATATLVGTMVGVGVFGVPFAFAKAGFLIGLSLFVFTALITLLMDYIYGEVILRTKEPHQLVGYAGFYEGVWAKRVIFFSFLLTAYAALLAYIIVAGEFLANIISPFARLSADTLSFTFLIVASLLVLAGIRAVSWIEVILAVLFMSVILMILLFGFIDIDTANYKIFDLNYWFFPYGVFLFAFTGMAAIPIQRRILAGQEHLMKKSILGAVVFVFVAYLIFGLTVFGISGQATSPEAVNGLIGFVNERIILLASLFGALAVSTSFLMLGTSMAEVFTLDYNFKRFSAWLFVMIPPGILFWGGIRNFIDVISIGGTIAVGIESAMLIWIYRAARIKGNRDPEYSLKMPMWIIYGIGLMFIVAVVYELLS